MVSLGVVVPLLPKLDFGFPQWQYGARPESIGLFTTTWALVRFVFAPVLGLLSGSIRTASRHSNRITDWRSTTALTWRWQTLNIG